MKLFKPLDESSLRHLFSAEYAEKLLRLSYIGPVLTSAGTIESSPDAMILDMRKHPYVPLRCEFKYEPSGVQDFSHNGRFDIAIVWSLCRVPSRKGLLSGLLSQNGCSELLALDEIKAFQELDSYSPESLHSLVGGDAFTNLRKLAIRVGFESVYALCIAAQLYPDNFRLDLMTDLLSRRFPRVKKMALKGRKNVVLSFAQSKPPYLVRMHGKHWKWASGSDSRSAAQELIQLIRINFESDPPTKDDLDAVRG